MLQASGGAVSITGTIYATINNACQDKNADEWKIVVE
jgi:hypothetical protein